MKDFHEGSYYVMTEVTPKGRTTKVVQCRRITKKNVIFAVGDCDMKLRKCVFGHGVGAYDASTDTIRHVDAEETDWQGSPLSIARFEEGNAYRLHAAGAGIGYGQQTAVCISVTPDFVRMSTPGHTLTFKKRSTDASCNNHEYIRAVRGCVEYYANASEAAQ